MTSSMLMCPGGHNLPHKTNRGACTPLWCVHEKIDPRKGSVEQRVAKKIVKEDAKKRGERVAKIKREEIERGMMQIARKEVRAGLTEAAPELGGEEAESWALQKISRLLPDAVAELEYQLKFGDDKQRMDAARDVLDANGLRKRDAMGASGQTIVLNVSGPLPWQLSSQPAINGAVVTAPLKETHAQKQLGENAGSPKGGVSKG